MKSSRQLIKPLIRPLAILSIGAVLSINVAVLSGCGNKDDPANAQVKAQEYIERAESYRRQGQYRAAIIETRNALQQNPQDRASALELATIFNELGQGKAATKLLEPFASDASHEEAIALAQGYFLQHKYQSSVDYLVAHASRLSLDKDLQAGLIRARALLNLGRLDEAQLTLGKLDEKDIKVRIERLHLLQQRGDLDAAKAEADSLLQKFPEDVDVLSEAAAVAERQSHLDQAEDFLSKALINLPQTDILLPQKAAVLQRLVSTLTKLGRSNEALVYAKTLSEANPSGTLLQDKLKQGLELFQAGKLDEAEASLSEVYNESQNDTVGMLLGMIHYAKKDLKGASEYLSKNIDPEVAPEAALTTLAATQLQLAQPEKLLTLFDAADRKRIKSPELKILIGIALLQTGSTDEGSQLVQSALAEQPENPAINATLARYYLSAGQADKAIALLEPAVKVKPDDNLSRMLITAYISAKQPDRALATARALANTNPPKAENWWVLGRAALYLQKPDIAEPALRQALQQQPDLLSAQIDLAQLHIMRKQSSQAETIYRSILKQHPELIPALRGLTAALAQSGAKNDSIESQLLTTAGGNNAKAVVAEYYLRQRLFEDADRILTTIPATDYGVYALQVKQQLGLIRATQALHSGEYDKARSFVATGLEANPGSPELLIMLARLDLQAKNIESAKKIAAQLTQTRPAPLPVQELLGDIAMIEGDTDKASAIYRGVWAAVADDGIATKLYQSIAKSPRISEAFLSEWIQRLPESATARFLMGVSKQQAGNNKGAITDYEAAIARNPKDPRALNNLAWLYFEQGEPRALELAEKAYAIQPENSAILDTYGWILAKTGQQKHGIDLLQKAVSLDPRSQAIRDHLKQANEL